MDTKTCKICGAELSAADAYCSVCGSKAIDNEEVVIKTRKASPKYNLPLLIRSGILLLVSAVMLAFSFLPLVKWRVDLEPYLGIETDINYEQSTIDSIMFFFDSLKEYDEEYIEESELAEEVVELVLDISDADIKNLSRYEERAFKKILTNVIRLQFMSEDFEPVPGMTAAAITSLLYLIFAAAFFGIALSNMLLVILKKRPIFTVTVAFLCSLPILLLSAYFSISSFEWRPSFYITALISIILSLSTICYLAVERIILTKGAAYKKIILNSISFTFALVTLCLTFTPILNTKIRTVFDGSTKERETSTSVGIGYFGGLSENVEASLDQDTIRETIFPMFSEYSKNEVSRGEADLVNHVFLNEIVSYSILDEAHMPFALAFVVMLLVLVFSALIASQNLMYLCIGKKSRPIVIASKILCAFFAVIVLGMAIAYSIIANFSVDSLDLTKNYSVSISPSVVVLLVFSVITACIPSKDKRVVYVDSTKDSAEAQ